MTVAAWTAVILAVLAVAVPGVRAPSAPAAPHAGAGLPDRFAGYSTLTGGVAAAPPGRAIALYGYGSGELFNMHQAIVVGADRDTYRRVEAIEDRDLASALLSPDGTRVLVGDDRSAVTDLWLLDLATGRQRKVPVSSAAVGVRLLAWSPDGRYVAYGAAPVPTDTDGGGNFVDYHVARTGVLRILDLNTGGSTEVAAAAPAWTAAFAPDSRRLAVQVGVTVHVLDLDGTETATIELPADRQLVGDVGWSPDGTLLATELGRGGRPTAPPATTCTSPCRDLSRSCRPPAPTGRRRPGRSPCSCSAGAPRG